jgi:hypothetical protein
MLGRYSEGRQFREGPAHAIEVKTVLPCEYAKYKNRAGVFTVPHNVWTGARELNSSPGNTSGNSAMSDDFSRSETVASEPPRKPLMPAAQRALAEAEARRQAAAADAKPLPKEFQGPKGPEPTRYGDWENKGIASDF